MSLNHERVQPILRVDGLNVELKIRNKQKKLVENVSFEVEPGQCLGILGESGSGKSMTVKAILGLLDRQFRIEGQAWFEGKDLCRAGRDELRRLRGQKIGMVLQNPMTCFDPLYRIGSQMAETFAAHTDWDRAKIREISLEVLEKMRIHNPEEVLGQYPHQLSGGMLQRIMIGLALAMKPALLVADEPTTAIDAITQAEILKEFQRIKEESHTAMIFISHDLGAVSKIADEIVVMNGGKLVEQGDFEHILRHAKDPYTRMLAETRRSVMERYRLCLDNQEELCLNICVSFRSERQDKLFGTSRDQVLFDVSLQVEKGSCLGILGETGSGKSTVGRVLCGLLKPDSGQVLLDGEEIYRNRQGRKNLQKKISIVFQDYTTSANPRFRIRDILAEGQRAAARKKGIRKLSREKIKKGAGELMEMVGLSSDFLDRYPHELSGGQLQRVCIARAVACEPEIILFDEAISSLDAHTQVQVMDLLIDLKEKLNLTYVFITHDLTSVTYLCDEVLFLYRGHITECRPVRELGKTTDEYARRLLQAIV